MVLFIQSSFLLLLTTRAVAVFNLAGCNVIQKAQATLAVNEAVLVVKSE
jgi:hypothetical protein